MVKSVSTQITQELAQMDTALASTQRTIKEHYAELQSELEDEATRISAISSKNCVKVAAPEDMRFRDAMIAEKGEPISDYHLTRWMNCWKAN